MSEYEFSEAQNVEIRDLAAKMSFVGTVGAIFGECVAVAGIAMALLSSGVLAFGFGNVAQGAVAFFVGVWTRAAAKSFRLIADTRGSDMQNLGEALRHMRRIYGLQRFLYVVALLLIGIALSIGIVMSLPKPPL